MKAVELIERRQAAWQELEAACTEVKRARTRRDFQKMTRFAALYRDACADLALAPAYQLPPKTVEYLHSLVARAHNQLYRSQSFRWREWLEQAFIETPRLIFQERCVQFCAVLFWLLFGISAFLAWEDSLWPGFANSVLGDAHLEQLEANFNDADLTGTGGGRSVSENMFMLGFYIFNNAGIGLTCFVMMLLVLPGLVILSFNAVFLGATFGYMLRGDAGEMGNNFQIFVTAHGPFELTAVILAAGAGLRIGFSWIQTQGLARLDSLRKNARRVLPIAICAVVCFCLAALIEGFISPMPGNLIPWWAKGMTAIISSTVLMAYFVVQGMDWSRDAV